jgi:hypothetical protein
MDEDKYLNYIKNNDFNGLLEYSNNKLTSDLNDKLALEYKAKALLSLGRYKDSYNILSSQFALQNEYLSELRNLNKALLNFIENYKYYDGVDYPTNWLEVKLTDLIAKTEEEFIKHNNYSKADLQPLDDYLGITQSKATIDLHNYLNNQFYEIYILGPQLLVEDYGYIHIQKLKLKNKLRYPFAQVLRNGYVYTKEQNHKLPFKFPEEDDFYWAGDEEETARYFKRCPLFNAPFPLIDWYLDFNKVTKPHPETDVYFSNSIVSPYLHRLVNLNLDKLANVNKDYFVPMYHNIIDPNLTAIEQESVYKWTATDFIIEEDNRSRFNTLVNLQLSIQKLGLKLSKYILEKVKSCLQNKRIPKAHIASPISNIPVENNLELYVAVEEIFNIALPILSKMTKPALYLPGKLQAVIKAQLIYLKPGEEYEGV